MSFMFPFFCEKSAPLKSKNEKRSFKGIWKGCDESYSLNQTFVQCTSEKHKNIYLLVVNDLDVLKYDPLFAPRLPPLLHPYLTYDMYNVDASFEGFWQIRWTNFVKKCLQVLAL